MMNNNITHQKRTVIDEDIFSAISIANYLCQTVENVEIITPMVVIKMNLNQIQCKVNGVLLVISSNPTRTYIEISGYVEKEIQAKKNFYKIKKALCSWTAFSKVDKVFLSSYNNGKAKILMFEMGGISPETYMLLYGMNKNFNINFFKR